ncbi:hypothetical protein GCM10023310_25040 [Paenibacillus vulneris]|uniref:L,D-transpeptidase n=1 Tax=Paenibacillus vulneris TaxID=1133364 RepID=A0ABW3USC5_9BACL
MKLIKTPVLVIICLFLSLLGIGPGSASAAPSAIPLEALQEEGVYIEINKKNNTLVVYVNGRPHYYFSVATGRRKDLTPVGEFHIVTKIVKPYYVRKKIPGGHPQNPLGTRWLGLSVPGTGGYMYGIHGTNRPYSIGSHASSGCVRMHNRDVEWLYRHIPLGTKVIIKEK